MRLQPHSKVMGSGASRPRQGGQGGGAPLGQRLGIWAAGFACFTTLYATQLMMPALAQSFALPLPRMGETVTAALVAVALLAPLVGHISDRLGRRRLIMIAAWALVVPTVLAAFAPTYPLFLACRFAQGICMPFIFSLVITFINEEWPAHDALHLTGEYQVAAIFGGFFGRVGRRSGAAGG
jgi:MFS transporter, YNFM family, putative membrane transport protein